MPACSFCKWRFPSPTARYDASKNTCWHRLREIDRSTGSAGVSPAFFSTDEHRDICVRSNFGARRISLNARHTKHEPAATRIATIRHATRASRRKTQTKTRASCVRNPSEIR
jgi:hypothetical protein